MKPQNAAILTGIIVTGGTWAQEKKLRLELLAASVFYAILLIGLGSANEQLASNFAMLVLVVAVLAYMVPLLQGLGLVRR